MKPNSLYTNYLAKLSGRVLSDANK